MGGRSARTTQKSRRAKKKVTLDESGKVRLLNEFRAALKDNNQELAKEKLSLSYHRRNNFFVQLLLDQFFDSLDSNQVQAESALSSIRGIAQLEQEISGDRFTLDLYHFLRSASPETLAADKIARAKYLKAQQHYDSLQTVGSKAEAILLLSQSALEFGKLGDRYESFLAMYLKALFLSYPDKNNETVVLPIAISDELEVEAKGRNYHQLSLHVESLQLNLQDFQPQIRQKKIDELGSLIKIVNDQNAYFSLVLLSTKKDDLTYQVIEQGIGMVCSKSLENKDRQNIYGRLSNILVQGRKVHKFASIESELEGAYIAISSNIRIVSSQGWRRIGERFLWLGEYDKAQENLERALINSEQLINAPKMTSDVHFAMGELALSKMNYANSIIHFDQALESDPVNLSNAQGKFALISMFRALAGIGNKERIEQALLKIKDIIKSHKLSPKDELVFQEKLKRTLVEYYLTQKKDTAKALEVYAGNVLETYLGNPGDDFVGEQILQLQSSISTNSQKIVFLVGNGESSAWVISNENYEYYRINIGQRELSEKVEKLLSLLGSKPSLENQTKASGLSKELFLTLISPLEKSIKKGAKLLFYSDYALNLLPFAYLQNPQNERFLFQDHEIQVIKEINRASKKGINIENADPHNELFVGISNPAFDRVKNPELNSLESADLEVERISALFPRSKILRGEGATLSQTVTGFKEAQILHISAHSILDENNAWNSKFLLSNSITAGQGDLTANLIRQMNLSHIKFACITSCSSAGLVGDDGNTIGLGPAFLKAGVPVVLVSLWDIDSKETAEFITKFYSYYRTGKTPSQSLRLTQIDSLNLNQMSLASSVGAAFVVISRN